MADFIGGEVNLGYYTHNPSGSAQNGNDKVDIESDLKWEEENDMFLKVYFEHPVPIIPNVKLGYTKFSHSGEGKATKGFSWGVINIGLNGDIDSKLDLNIYDIALYYELLDNWLNFDVGVNIKYLDGSIDVNSDETSVNLPIPMLYAKARVNIPATDLSFQAEGNYISYGDNALFDLEVGARYTFALGFGVEAGYKAFKIKLDDVDDTSMDADFNGLYGKIVWDF
jgi:outer membrane protein